ncbi:ribosomal-protein-alanine N-acetyltransferase [candidate division WOR-1 bacterium RIFCSPHIGHO2_01_FULL_53_15]|uniref:[Ribosomal protein bS18]-alanine N-acetyltransferase n=1 Tax=candidate division WOR-1 bacterium RIFCSPHIGHO2_01_FULL_53_15 TaxID=1802564 RepID=A0A1F4Q2N9_UNCSA|nr:MAG: ribosomal-protein-alanine N-acetyltransferase [candidate division WOR-1 bacterium RIFCSPHIGHO2_01_FULL_53_15]OGC13217.1 MAG: ribosomal-protein-alanine N-acetyltransferase [candidate division WOR-1 bacterium RIFCSPHIGHO2_02_FULL_53_26]
MIVITPMKDKDIAAVVEIEKLCFKFPKPEAIFREDEHKYLVARDDDQIVGYIGIEKVLDEEHIINMAVHPDYRGKGIGRRLIQHVLNDEEVFFLEVRTSNETAKDIYEKYGFKVISIRKAYYPDGEDAYVMRRIPGE